MRKLIKNATVILWNNVDMLTFVQFKSTALQREIFSAEVIINIDATLDLSAEPKTMRRCSWSYRNELFNIEYHHTLMVHILVIIAIFN